MHTDSLALRHCCTSLAEVINHTDSSAAVEVEHSFTFNCIDFALATVRIAIGYSDHSFSVSYPKHRKLVGKKQFTVVPTFRFLPVSRDLLLLVQRLGFDLLVQDLVPIVKLASTGLVVELVEP